MLTCKLLSRIGWALVLGISPALADENWAARVVESAGSPYQKGMELKEGAGLRTGSKGYLKLELADHSYLELGSWASVNLTKARSDEQVELDLEFGKVRAYVKPREGKKRNFLIRTKTSTMGVRGTLFVVAVPPSPNSGTKTEYYCLSGSVEVKDPAGKQSAVVGPGMGLTVTSKVLAPERLSVDMITQAQTRAFLDSGAPQKEAKPKAKDPVEAESAQSTDKQGDGPDAEGRLPDIKK